MGFSLGPGRVLLRFWALGFKGHEHTQLAHQHWVGFNEALKTGSVLNIRCTPLVQLLPLEP